MQIILSLHRNWINKSIFQARDLAPDFHKHVDDSHHGIARTYSSLYKRRILFDLQAKYAMFAISERDVSRAQYARNDLGEEGLFKIAANNSNTTILFQEYIRVISLALFMVIIIFRTLQFRLPRGPVFQGLWRVICMYNKTKGIQSSLREKRDPLSERLSGRIKQHFLGNAYLPFLKKNIYS